MSEQLQMVFGNRRLPTKDNDIDWDVVCEDYYSYILSPFSPEMVETQGNGKSRNLILEHLNSIPESDLINMQVLDLGCGPGNIIPHISNKIKYLVGIDQSTRSINMAEKIASNHNEITFKGVASNILDIGENEKYDLVISSNSILPKNRSEVVRLFSKTREILNTNGKFIAILPAFDTTLYLRGLWKEHYKKLGVSGKQLDRISDDFNKAKLLNEETLSYADDGHNIQCYHTSDSIIDETRAAGLRLTEDPQKVYYPWELTNKFDYGYFPDAEEEIWDWFIVADRGEMDD